MNTIPFPRDLIKTFQEETGLESTKLASIREIVQLVNKIEHHTGVKFIRMEMGVPGLPTPSYGIEGEMEALKNGVSAIYPDITGLGILKSEASRFIKLFLNVDISPAGC